MVEQAWENVQRTKKKPGELEREQWAVSGWGGKMADLELKSDTGMVVAMHSL